MLNINQGEKEKIYEWAWNNDTSRIENGYLINNDKKERTSCFEKRAHRTEYCREYIFQTMPELRNELDMMWEDDDIMKQIEKVVLVASMKEKPRKIEKDNREVKKEKEGQLKPFIYNF